MAFDIMSLFSPQARNMLLQPYATNPDNLLIAPQMQDYTVAGIPQNALVNPQAAPVPQNVPIPTTAPPQMQQAAPQPQQMVPALGQGSPRINDPQMVAAGSQPTIGSMFGGQQQTPQGVYPTMTGSVQQGQPGQTAGASPMGLGDRLRSFIDGDRGQYFHDMFTGWAAGSNPGESLGMGAKLAGANYKTNSDTNQNVDWLKSRGIPADQAHLLAANPTALGDYLKQIYAVKQKSFQQLANGDFGSVDGEGNFTKQGTAAKPVDAFHQLSADEIKSRGLDPTKSYQVGVDGKVDAIGGGGITINNGDGKLPANYRWVDPNNQNAGVEPIPGGPGEQLPAEAAGRIGLADNFLKQFPDLQKKIEDGSVTGFWDRAQAGNNESSDQANTYRQVQSGVDALTRMLTGAGQNEQEARAYASRYLPSYTDDAKSASAKLTQLAQELQSAKGTVLRGRGAASGGAASPPASDPFGIR